MMRAFALCALAALAACGREPAGKDDGQPEIVSNIVEDAVPEAGEARQPENRAEAQAQPAADSIPAALQGRWTGLPDACGDRAAALELNIGPDSLIFHESVGQVEAVKRGEDGDMRVTAAFTGEGESWTRTLTLRPAADGATLTIVNDGTATVRKRC
ncbi:hypothetical protein [Sphingobium amiense]|nr:hypothetical protein [Sphingobium amiense]